MNVRRLRMRQPEAELVGRGDGDAELIARARRDPQAFAPLYRRYVTDVYRYCDRCPGNRQAAEDATATVFTRALAGLPG